MAVETIYSESSDGGIILGGPATAGSNWTTIRNADVAVSATSTSTTHSIYAVKVAGKGATFFDISRYFLYFDMSGFPTYSTIDSIVISVYRQTGGGDSMIAVRHDNPSVHVSTPEYVFFPDHDPASGDTMTAYSSVNTEGHGAFNDYTLNSTARTELIACIAGSGNGGVGTSSFEVALVSNLDYANSEPTNSTESSIRVRSQNYSSTTYDPHMDVTYSTAVADNATFFGANF